MDLWERNSIGGLAMNLAREGYLPIVTGKACAEILPAESIRVLIEPRKPIGTAETKMLLDGMADGHHLLISAGPIGSANCRELLGAAGLTVKPIPLGPVPIGPNLSLEEFQKSRKDPQFSGAWAIQAEESPEVQVHYRAWGIPIVVTRKMNKGHLTLIADPEFLVDKTLEAENDYWEGNLTLFRTILQQRRRE
ncbi:MAG: hypothetical protein O6947_04415 [Acidobacteria bacterium]|nr:hypothetical protein [Acidobacteriota bacterium]